MSYVHTFYLVGKDPEGSGTSVLWQGRFEGNQDALERYAETFSYEVVKTIGHTRNETVNLRYVPSNLGDEL